MAESRLTLTARELTSRVQDEVTLALARCGVRVVEWEPNGSGVLTSVDEGTGMEGDPIKTVVITLEYQENYETVDWPSEVEGAEE